MQPQFRRIVFLYCSLGLLAHPSTAQVIYEDLHLVPKYAKAHGIIMGLTFTVMLPLGVFIVRCLRMKHTIWIHAGWQVFSWLMMISGLGIGVRLGKILDMLHNNPHTILGTVVVALLLLQPFLGLIHHLRFRKRTAQEKTLPVPRSGTWTALLHVWYGRILILLGIVNGGLGLRLAGNSQGGEIAYGVIGGISGVGVLGVVCWVEGRKVLGRDSRSAGEERQADQGVPAAT